MLKEAMTGVLIPALREKSDMARAPLEALCWCSAKRGMVRIVMVADIFLVWGSVMCKTSLPRVHFRVEMYVKSSHPGVTLRKSQK